MGFVYVEFIPFAYSVFLFFSYNNDDVENPNPDSLRYRLSKVTPILVLAVIAYRQILVDAIRSTVVYAFLMSAAGDYALVGGHDNEFAFVVGILAFSLSHIAYVSTFYQGLLWSGAGTVIYSLLVALAVIAVPNVRSKLVKVVGGIYGFILSTALWLAVSEAYLRADGVGLVRGLGYLSFVSSDAVLILTTFCGLRFIRSGRMIMFTYYFAQFLLLYAHLI